MTRPVSRREQNKERTRAAILEVARARFTAHGVDGTTMDDIAAAAGVSRATLFNYFNGKTALLDGLAEDTRHAFADRIARCCAATDDPAERIMTVFSGAGERLERERSYWGPVVGHSELGWNDASIVPRLDELLDQYDRLLGADLPGAERHAAERRLIAELAVGAYLNMVQRWRFDEAYPLRDRLVATAAWIGEVLRQRGLI
ncbi:TetR/AcrR family transcriptional regulator [Flavisphingomonas formosensis]|uniref:TetR/AcrR family transcriptional regulator n=1 Tax=Flavisphingomonas formosensis TaxID=861534 RepID=UPI0012FBE896|nr:TetR/AcrR family transcriptional regulator [Sphingomonas formosensis]